MKTETLKVVNNLNEDDGCTRYMIIAADNADDALRHFKNEFGGKSYSAPGYWFQHEPYAWSEPVGRLESMPLWKVTQHCGYDI